MNNIDKIHYAIIKINPTAQVTISADKDTSLENVNIIFHNCNSIPKEQIIAKIPEVELDMALANLRQKRNKLLADTDYLALADNTLSEPMKSYRKSLRDITEGLSTVEQVNSVEFPVKP